MSEALECFIRIMKERARHDFEQACLLYVLQAPHVKNLQRPKIPPILVMRGYGRRS